METKEAVDTLKVFKRWLSGKGKKYLPTGLPVSVGDVASAIDLACSHFKHRICPIEFRALVRMAIRSGAYDAIDKDALKSARKVIRYLDKKGV